MAQTNIFTTDHECGGVSQNLIIFRRFTLCGYHRDDNHKV